MSMDVNLLASGHLREIVVVSETTETMMFHHDATNRAAREGLTDFVLPQVHTFTIEKTKVYPVPELPAAEMTSQAVQQQFELLGQTVPASQSMSCTASYGVATVQRASNYLLDNGRGPLPELPL